MESDASAVSSGDLLLWASVMLDVSSRCHPKGAGEARDDVGEEDWVDEDAVGTVIPRSE